MRDTRLTGGRARLPSVPSSAIVRGCWTALLPSPGLSWRSSPAGPTWSWNTSRSDRSLPSSDGSTLDLVSARPIESSGLPCVAGDDAGRPSTAADIRALAYRMAAENPTWGAPRFHGEIQKPGLVISERTISRFMPRRPVDPAVRQHRRTFLRNHREVIAAIDFFTLPTATFRVLHDYLVVHHARRALMHFRVTGHPTSAWITQQLREAFPYDQAPRYLILDRDAKYGDDVLAVIRHLGIEPKQITARRPRHSPRHPSRRGVDAVLAKHSGCESAAGDRNANGGVGRGAPAPSFCGSMTSRPGGEKAGSLIPRAGHVHRG